jgi:asparagine synthase (glutamine-hydrolysing)
MRLGFLVMHDGGNHTVFKRYAPSGECKSPLVSYAHNQSGSVILMGRIYYQNELLIEPDEKNKSSPAATVLRVYERFGAEGLRKLEGDFSCVVLDAPKSRMLALRDPMGGYPLFWIQRNGFLALSTSLKPLLELAPGRRINSEYLADFLMAPTPFNELPTDASVFEGLSRVRPGVILSAHLRTGDVSCQDTWNWMSQIVRPEECRIEDVGEEYRHILCRGIEQRLEGRCASHLSGGMDSTAVTLLACDSIRRGIGEAPLQALSLLYRRLPALAREASFLDALMGSPDYQSHQIDADELLDFDSFVEPPLHDEPYMGLWRLGMDRAIVRAAENCGAKTILTGIGADEVLDLIPLHLRDLLRRGNVREAWNEAVRWARFENCNAWSVLYPYGLANLFAGCSWLTHSGKQTEIRREHDWTIPPWIQPSFVRRHSLRARAVENARRMYASEPTSAMSFALHSVRSRAGDVVRWSVAGPKEMMIAHPFLDPRVLCLGLGVMSRFLPQPGRKKPLLAEAMRGILPEHIRNRQRKGHFNEVYYLGLSRNLAMLERLIDSAPVAEFEMIDKEALLHYVRDASCAGAHVRQLHRMNVTLSLLKWLSMQKLWYEQEMSQNETFQVILGPPTGP